MKRFNDLSEAQQARAIEQCVAEVLNDFIEENFVPKEKAMREFIQATLAKADQLETPWFAGEMLMDNEEFRLDIEKLAKENAEKAWYPEEYDCVVFLV